MGILDQIKEKLSGAGIQLPGGPESVVGIDIGSASIKVVQLRREDGRAVLETYGSLTLGPYAKKEAGRVTKLNTQDLSTALADLMSESNVNIKNAALAVPFASSLTSIIKMPNMPEDQLNKMVPLEARKYIPVSTSEVTMDWFVLPEPPKSALGGKIKDVSTSSSDKEVAKMIEILLVAIHNNILEDYQALVAAAGLDVQFYELEVFSVARSSLGQGVAPVMIVDIGASTTKIYVIESGVVRVSHLVNKGSQDLTLAIERSLSMTFEKSERIKQEIGLSALSRGGAATGASIPATDVDTRKVAEAMLSTLDYIFIEINRVLLSYGKQRNKNVTKVVFSGGTSAMHGFEEYARGKVDNTIEKADPFSKTLAPAFLNNVLQEIGPEFAVATGLALRYLYSKN